MKLFVRDLTVIDASYLCEARGMVGESWILDVVMSGELNEMSMVLDFSRVKKQIKQIVDEYVDHRLIVPTAAKLFALPRPSLVTQRSICCVAKTASTCIARNKHFV